MINVTAIRLYDEAQMLGNRRRDEAMVKVRDGIASFASPEDALLDAEENIARFTKSDFMLAHFYEVVKSEALKQIQRSTLIR